MTDFDEVRKHVREEAEAEGPEAVAELAALEAHYRLARNAILDDLRAKRTAHRIATTLDQAGIDPADVPDLAASYEPPDRYERLHEVITAQMAHWHELVERLNIGDLVEWRPREPEGHWRRRERFRPRDARHEMCFERATGRVLLTDEDFEGLHRRGLHVADQ